jgi:hypothetical protein
MKQAIALLALVSCCAPGLAVPAETSRGAQPSDWVSDMLAARAELRKAQPDRRRLNDLFRRFWEDYPETDWFIQDSPVRRPGESDALDDFAWYFEPRHEATPEMAMIRRVLDELGPAGAPLAVRLEELVRSGRGVEDPAWLNHYAKACRTRRDRRLAALAQRCAQWVFTRHATLGGSH